MCVGPAKPAVPIAIGMVWPWIFFCFFSLFQDKEKKASKGITFSFCVLSFACAKESTKPACRQAGKSTPAMMYSRCRRPDLASVLLLTQLNNTYHQHNPSSWDENTCFVIHWKPERRCVPFLTSLNLKYLFKRNGTRRYTTPKRQRYTSISDECISAFPMAW